MSWNDCRFTMPRFNSFLFLVKYLDFSLFEKRRSYCLYSFKLHIVRVHINITKWTNSNWTRLFESYYCTFYVSGRSSKWLSKYVWTWSFKKKYTDIKVSIWFQIMKKKGEHTNTHIHTHTHIHCEWMQQSRREQNGMDTCHTYAKFWGKHSLFFLVQDNSFLVYNLIIRNGQYEGRLLAQNEDTHTHTSGDNVPHLSTLNEEESK